MKALRYRIVLLTSSQLLWCAPASAQIAKGAADDVAQPAQASPAPLADSSAGDIVVTARRREERLQDVPIAISVTTGAQLATQNLTSLEAITARLPAIKITANTNSDTIAVRGISSGQNAGFEQAVGIFVDGVYRGRSRSTRSALFDAERVEVLKGPQTTYFGNNTVAGAVNITTRKPSDTFGGEVRAYFTPETKEYTVALAVEGPVTDTLSYRIIGESSGQDGWTYNTYESSYGPRQRDLQGRISLRWKPIEGFESDFRFDRAHNRDTNIDIGELSNCPAAPAYGGATGACATYLGINGANADTKLNYVNNTRGLFFNYDMEEAVWTNRLNIGENTLTLTSSYFHHTAAVTTNSQPIILPTAFANINDRGPFQNVESDRNFTQEIRFESPVGHLLQYTAGAYYLHDTLVSDGYVGFYTSPFGFLYAPAYYTATDPIALDRQLAQKTDTKSVFGAVTLTPLRGLRFNVGARYSSVDKTAHRFAVLGTAGAIPGPDNFVVGSAGAQLLLQPKLGINGADFTNQNANFSKFMPSASVQYDLLRTITAYFSYSQGFKAGGFAESNVPNTFDSETANSFEAGIKGSIPNTGIFFTLDAFTSTFKNLQVAYTFVSNLGVSSSLIANAASSRSRGIEGSINWKASPRLSMRTDVSYIDATFLDYKGGPCSDLLFVQRGATCLQDQTGMTRPFSPNWSGSAGLQYDLPVGSANRMRFEPFVYFSSRFNVSESLDPLLEQEGYAKVDFRVGYGPRSGKWEVAVIGKNLTDIATSQYRRTVGTSRGSTYARLEAPRTVSISATTKF